MTWYSSSGGYSGRTRLTGTARHEPFTPRVPKLALNRPGLLALLLITWGAGFSLVLITTMPRWPGWLLFPGLGLGVTAMASLALGAGLLAALALQPMIEGKEDLGWDDEPLTSMGVPVSLQRKCERMGYWTCEALSEAIASGTFPWSGLEYDERQQISRAVHFWRATSTGDD